MTLSLAWATHEGVECLVLRGLSAGALAYLGGRAAVDLAAEIPVLPDDVVRAGVDPGRMQSMLGRYTVTADEVRFTPRFPFAAGTSYSMIVRAPVISDEPRVLRIARPAAAGSPSTAVRSVFPAVRVLPRNALRFYVHFSAPMSEGMAARHVHLEGVETRERIFGAFSPMDFELWDPLRRRLTVLLDPARIKQGLAPHQEAGYPLEVGTAVVLVVEREFRDAAGFPLSEGHRQEYQVGPDIRSLVDPANWVVAAPRAGCRDPLTVRFDRPLDRALLEDCLAVAGGRSLIPGAIHIPAGEGSWSFTPSAPWIAGRHGLMVDPVLEDIAGNSVERVFDRDLDRADHEPRASALISVPFTVA